MNLLIIGGTRFLGRHLASAAVAAGHRVTLFHRGRDLGTCPGAAHVVGDREHDLARLNGGRWDAVVDTCGYFPRAVRASAHALRERAGHYLFVSTISVLADNAPPGQDESAPRTAPASDDVDVVTGETYGPLKAACEDAAIAAFGAPRTLIVRPGLLVGPHDPTGRFTWWVRRLQRSGPVLAPGCPEAPVQFIDARDAAAWMLRQAEAGTTGPVLLSGPVDGPLSMAGLLAGAAAALGSEVTPVWADEEFLRGQGVAPWTELPLWVPQSNAGMLALNLARARATGLVTRPLAETVRDTAAAEAPVPAGIGLAPEREAALLAAVRSPGVRMPVD